MRARLGSAAVFTLAAVAWAVPASAQGYEPSTAQDRSPAAMIVALALLFFAGVGVTVTLRRGRSFLGKLKIANEIRNSAKAASTADARAGAQATGGSVTVITAPGHYPGDRLVAQGDHREALDVEHEDWTVEDHRFLGGGEDEPLGPSEREPATDRLHVVDEPSRPLVWRDR